MTGKEWFLFIMTFLTGLFLGFYVYVMFFKPHYLPEDLGGDETTAAEFSVVAKAYGGSEGPEYIHPSFRLLGDGEYVYVAGGTGTDALEERHGTLPRAYMNELQRLATAEKLAYFAEDRERTDCRLFSGGVDHVYRFTVHNTDYTLDTCGTALMYEDELAQLMETIWGEIITPGSTGAPAGSAPYDWLEHKLKSYFDWQEER
ncbi:hypothetical protein H6783_03360 [Candidatus Nomurabacteria bacterium]|nr:hypothetical protein [Candidatus Nomurabacteria bacterium]